MVLTLITLLIMLAGGMKDQVLKNMLMAKHIIVPTVLLGPIPMNGAITIS
jgi:hypothetical protein